LKRGFIRRHTIEVDMDKVESVMWSQKGAPRKDGSHRSQAPVTIRPARHEEMSKLG